MLTSGTIYNGDSSIDFFLFALKKNFFLIRFLPKQMLGFLLYGLGRIEKTALKEYYFSFLSGIDAELLAEEFWKMHQEDIYQWYREQQQSEDIIISASPEFLLKPICNLLGVEHLIGKRQTIRLVELA